MLELPLPEINMARVHIVFDDQVSHANAAALTFGEEHWRKVEAPFLAGERPLQKTCGMPSCSRNCAVACKVFCADGRCSLTNTLDARSHHVQKSPACIGCWAACEPMLAVQGTGLVEKGGLHACMPANPPGSQTVQFSTQKHLAM